MRGLNSCTYKTDAKYEIWKGVAVKDAEKMQISAPILLGFLELA